MQGVAMSLLYVQRKLIIDWTQEIQQHVTPTGCNYSIAYPGNKSYFLQKTVPCLLNILTKPLAKN